MKLKSKIYVSQPANEEGISPRFQNQLAIQYSLKKICSAWSIYLKSYVMKTKVLFDDDSECPWENTERAIVSTLSAAITRKFRQSLVIEESRVIKPGQKMNEKARKKTDSGRCDLWASIPELKIGEFDFSFYLEAKKSGKNMKSAILLKKLLSSRDGISRMFRDYLKSRPERLDQRTPYKIQRKHEHFVVGMLILRLDKEYGDLDEIKRALSEVFEKTQGLDLRPTRHDKAQGKNARRMVRFPTTALILVDKDATKPGMIACFTVLGSTSKISRVGIVGSVKEEEAIY